MAISGGDVAAKLKQEGFSLVEVLIAMALLGASLLFITQLMLLGMKITWISNDETILNNAAIDRMEQLKNMAFDSLGSPSCLGGAAGCGDLTTNATDAEGVDYFDDTPDLYVIRWNITQFDEAGNALPVNSKRITVRVVSRKLGTTEDPGDAARVVRDVRISCDKFRF